MFAIQNKPGDSQSAGLALGVLCLSVNANMDQDMLCVEPLLRVPILFIDLSSALKTALIATLYLCLCNLDLVCLIFTPKRAGVFQYVEFEINITVIGGTHMNKVHRYF